jgi:hypothetical protein
MRIRTQQYVCMCCAHMYTPSHGTLGNRPPADRVPLARMLSIPALLLCRHLAADWLSSAALPSHVRA